MEPATIAGKKRIGKRNWPPYCSIAAIRRLVLPEKLTHSPVKTVYRNGKAYFTIHGKTKGICERKLGMKPLKIQISSANLVCEIFGEGNVTLVIEMGLGAMMAEWRRLARKLFRQQNIHRQTAELGYYLAEDYWGRDIMTEAIRQLCDILFETTDPLRIYAEPFAYNTGSRRALEKAGFSFEGILKNNAVKDGKVLDMAVYSMTRTMET